MARPVGQPRFQALDNDGNLAASYQLFTYEPGTTTDKTTYQDKAETTPNANPIILDARGECDLYLDGETKLVLKDASGSSTIWTQDNVNPVDTVDITEDTAPVLGGNLDLGTYKVTATSSGVAEIEATTVRLDGAVDIPSGDSLTINSVQYPTSTGPTENHAVVVSSTSNTLEFANVNDATQAEMEAGTETVKGVSPATAKHAPGVAKAWALVTFAGGTSTPTLTKSHNIASIAHAGSTGTWDITFTDNMDSGNYVVVGGSNVVSAADLHPRAQTLTASTFELVTFVDSGGEAPTDPASGDQVTFVVFGLLA